MLYFLCICFFTAAIYNWYKGVENYRIFKSGIPAKGRVTEIEKTIEYTNDGGEVERYWLHIELPDYKGLPLGKKYDQPIDPHRFRVGEILDIIQKADAPTEFLIQKDLTFMDNPSFCAILGLALFFLSFGSCHLASQ